MESFFQIITLSVIQGITEFLPVSSSGHLVLLPALTGWADQGQVMDVAAHLGSLGAVAFYVRRDIFAMLGGVGDCLRLRKTGPSYLVMMVILASLPAIAAGAALQLLDPPFLRLALTVAIANIIFALWLWWADRQPVTQDMSHQGQQGWQFDWQSVSLRQAILIGAAQALALIPGTSRSGVTMTMARQLGWDRLTAARFSLLLSLPVILGAGTLKGLSVISSGMAVDVTALVTVMALSFICALAAVSWMMGWLARAGFGIFIIYRLALGGVLLVCISAGVI